MREAQENSAGLARSKRLADVRLPFDQRTANLDFSRRLEPTVTIRGQTYREVDNGQAGVLVPVDDPFNTPAIRDQRRRAVERAFFQAEHPIGAALEGVAMLAGATPTVRDALLFGGSTLDAVGTGFAPRGGGAPSRRPSPPQPMPRREVDAGAIRLRPLNALGRATGVNSTLRKEMLGTGTGVKRSIQTPGRAAKDGTDRAHLGAKMLGFPGDLQQNLVTATRKFTNQSRMQRFDNLVKKMVKGGEFVEHSVTPLYGPGALPPRFILMSARGSGGSWHGRIIENPAGRPK